MEERLSFDTSFLIDIQREAREKHEGPAHRFLRQNSEAAMIVCAVAVGEFAEGFRDSNEAALESMLACFDVADIDLETSLIYGRNARRLRRAGRLIGSNDLWIGCSAVRRGVPLVTRDAGNFGRIENLRIIEYRHA